MEPFANDRNASKAAIGVTDLIAAPMDRSRHGPVHWQCGRCDLGSFLDAKVSCRASLRLGRVGSNLANLAVTKQEDASARHEQGRDREQAAKADDYRAGRAREPDRSETTSRLPAIRQARGPGTLTVRLRIQSNR